MIGLCRVAFGWCLCVISWRSACGSPALLTTLSTGAAKSSFLKRAKFVRRIRACQDLLARPSLIRTRFRSIHKQQLAAPLRQQAGVLGNVIRQVLFLRTLLS